MTNREIVSANFLLDQPDGSHLLLDYYSSFSQQLLNASSRQEILQLVYTELRNIYAGMHVDLLLFNNDKQLLKISFEDDAFHERDFHSQHSLYTHVIDHRIAVLTNSYRNFCDSMELATAAVPASSWLGCPLISGKETLGMVAIWDESPEAFLRLQDKQFTGIVASMAAMALKELRAPKIATNGHYKQTPQPFVLKNGIGTKGVMASLQHWLVSQFEPVYSGVFLRGKNQQRWRLLSSQQMTGSTTEIDQALINQLDKTNTGDWPKKEWMEVRSEDHDSDYTRLFRHAFPPETVGAGIIFPFSITGGYLGALIVGADAGVQLSSSGTFDLMKLILHTISQLIDKQAIQDRHRKFEKYIQHLERLKVTGELASSTAHHLNNILSVIIGKGQLLQKELEGTRFYEEMEIILRAGLDGAQRIQRLQSYSGKRSGDEQPLLANVNTLIEEVMEITRPRYEQEAQMRGIHFDIELGYGKVRPVRGDLAELREVILNMVSNALDAMPRGGKLAISTSQKDDQVLIFVTDSGIGIPFEVRNKIFEAFFTTKGQHGNGLGLSIAREIVEKHGGHVYVDSIPQKGSTFMIELPTVGEKLLPIIDQPELLQPLNYRILLVEAEGVVRETLAQMLKAEGCEVIPAANAQEALLRFQKHECDIVFTDLSMPNVNGIDLASRVKKIAPHIPVFLVTGWNQDSKILEGAQEVVDGIIQKPFNMDRIRQKILSAISSKGHYHRNGHA